MIFNDCVITIARSWLGTPYLHQASVKGVGCDCLGLIRGVWREVYGTEPETPPPYASDWAEVRTDDPLMDAALRHMIPKALDVYEPADVALFRWREGLPAKHCAILTSPTTMIHAHDGACVAEVPFRPWWQRHVVGLFGFVERGE
jgi:NlpC/P60 family putative phage cell wall peptidase